MASEHEAFPVQRREEGRPAVETTDVVACEEPMEIRVAGRGVGVTMRTPGHDEELALGFLVGEGVLKRREDVEHVRRCDQAIGDVLDVIVAPGVAVDFAALTRHVFASSSCGVCGTASVEAVRKQFPRVGPGPVVAERVFHGLTATLRSVQATFEKTGGLHAAGLFTAEGKLLVAREDVGRHNAVDKVVGWAFMHGMLPLSPHVLLVSGRVSFEIVQKALAAGVPIVAAISAPSSLAIDLAQEGGVTLVGFLRPGRFNVYAGGERVG